jgi:hypothetical protein
MTTPPPDPSFGIPGNAQPGAYGVPNQPGAYGVPNQPGAYGVPGQVPGVSLGAVARKRGMRQITIGSILFIVGLVITVVTYGRASSSPTGGSYFVAYGPMIFGVISVIRGVVAVAQSQKLNSYR